MKRTLSLFFIVILFVLVYPFSSDNKVNAQIENGDIIIDEENIIVYKDDGEVFRFSYKNLYVYKTIINGYSLYSLWTEDSKSNSINVGEYKIIDISLHNAFDEILPNLYDEDLYIKVIYKDEFEHYYYNVSRLEYIDIKFWNNYQVYDGEEFYERAYLDYALNLRTMDVSPANSVEYFNYDQILDTNFDIDIYYDNIVGNTSDDNAIINFIPKNYFTHVGEYGKMGESLGYYIKTSLANSNYEGYSYISEVLIFKINYFTQFFEEKENKTHGIRFTNSISPIINCVYCTYSYDASIWKSYKFNPLKDKIVRYSNSLTCANQINMIATSIHTDSSCEIFDITRIVNCKNEVSDKETKCLEIAKMVLSIIGKFIPDVPGQEYLEISYDIYKLIDQLSTIEDDENVDEELENIKEKYGSSTSNAVFHLNSMENYDRIQDTDCTSYVFPQYEKIYNDYGSVPKYMSFSNIFNINYTSNEDNIALKLCVKVDDYYITSQEYTYGCKDIKDVQSVKYGNVNEKFTINSLENKISFGFSPSTSDNYFINSNILNGYGSILKLRIFLIDKGTFTNYESVSEYSCYLNNFKYYNISALNYFDSSYYYFIYLELVDGDSVTFDFNIRNSFDYSTTDDNSLIFDFNENNEIWVSYKLNSNATIGATMMRFSALSITDNVDTIIEVYNNKFQLVAIDDDGYFDEESDAPSLGSITDKIPIYVNNQYYIRIRHRGDASNIKIKFEPCVKEVWYYNGDIYL